MEPDNTRTSVDGFPNATIHGGNGEIHVDLGNGMGEGVYPSPVHDANDVVASMRDNVYESITLKLGDGCTVDEIAREYNANKSFYDSMTDDHVKY